MVASLLEGGRDERGRDVGLKGVKGRVVTAGRGQGADSRVGGYGVEGTLIKHESAKYIILNEMKEVVRGEGESKRLGVQIYGGLDVGSGWRFS